MRWPETDIMGEGYCMPDCCVQKPNGSQMTGLQLVGGGQSSSDWVGLARVGLQCEYIVQFRDRLKFAKCTLISRTPLF